MEVTVIACCERMSHRNSQSLDDTLPLNTNASGSGVSESNKSYYGSDLSDTASKNSNDSSVKIVYEFINLEDSKSDSGETKK